MNKPSEYIARNYMESNVHYVAKDYKENKMAVVVANGEVVLIGREEDEAIS